MAASNRSWITSSRPLYPYPLINPSLSVSCVCVLTRSCRIDALQRCLVSSKPLIPVQETLLMIRRVVSIAERGQSRVASTLPHCPQAYEPLLESPFPIWLSQDAIWLSSMLRLIMNDRVSMNSLAREREGGKEKRQQTCLWPFQKSCFVKSFQITRCQTIIRTIVDECASQLEHQCCYLRMLFFRESVDHRRMKIAQYGCELL